MIYPTGRAIGLLIIGAPVALMLALTRPDLWVIAIAWLLFLLALILMDGWTSGRTAQLDLNAHAPAEVGVGDPFQVHLSLVNSRNDFGGAHIALATDERLSSTGRIDARVDVHGKIDLPLTAYQRGTAEIRSVSLRQKGIMGLAWKQRTFPLDLRIVVTPSIRNVREDGMKLFTRDSTIGQRIQPRMGEGQEFEALVKFRPGMDRRAIDWKQSARHTDLLAKEYEIERDNRIVLAIDCGRAMSEPMLDVAGLSTRATTGDIIDLPQPASHRVDRAVAAALTLGYTALKFDDRVSLFAFSGRPVLSTRVFQHVQDFPHLRAAAADIGYDAQETNFTLGLASLAAQLNRRSLIVMFTECTQASVAELMLKAAERLVRNHRLLFVTLSDDELESAIRQHPDDASDVTRANMAAELLRDRRIVLTRLRRMGADVVEAQGSHLSARLLNQYLSIKRRGI